MATESGKVSQRDVGKAVFNSASRALRKYERNLRGDDLIRQMLEALRLPREEYVTGAIAAAEKYLEDRKL